MWGWNLSVGRKIEVIGLAGVAAALVAAAWWGVWSMFAPVPEVHAVPSLLYGAGDSRNAYLELPFAVSRWWDIAGAFFVAELFGAIWLILLPSLHTNGPSKDNPAFGLVFGLVSGLGIGQVYGLGFGLGYGLGYGLVSGLGIGLFLGPVIGVSLATIARVKNDRQRPYKLVSVLFLKIR